MSLAIIYFTQWDFHYFMEENSYDQWNVSVYTKYGPLAKFLWCINGTFVVHICIGNSLLTAAILSIGHHTRLFQRKWAACASNVTGVAHTVHFHVHQALFPHYIVFISRYAVEYKILLYLHATHHTIMITCTYIVQMKLGVFFLTPMIYKQQFNNFLHWAIHMNWQVN